jgi:hypothetical protein
VLLAVVYIIKKCRLYFDVPRHEDVVLQNVRDAGSQPRARRWEGILKEDEKITEANVETFPEQTISVRYICILLDHSYFIYNYLNAVSCVIHYKS